jgi:hypothetical protein
MYKLYFVYRKYFDIRYKNIVNIYVLHLLVCTIYNLSNILIYVQQDATLHNLFYLETALHVSSGTTTHHQELKQLDLQHLVFVTLLLML